MGNAWFGKKRSSSNNNKGKGVVHPVAQPQAQVQGVTLKVRMSKGQLKDLMEKVEMSKANHSELGRLIVQECSNGRLHARVAGAGDGKYGTRGWGLRPIQEHI